MGRWLTAQEYPTKGFYVRKGFHCVLKPEVPHLKMLEDRVWKRVEIKSIHTIQRPNFQGTTWYIANKMRILD